MTGFAAQSARHRMAVRLEIGATCDVPGADGTHLVAEAAAEMRYPVRCVAVFLAQDGARRFPHHESSW